VTMPARDAWLGVLRRFPALGLLLMATMGALGGCAGQSISVKNAFSFACAAGDECAVYLTLTNSGREADRLVSAQTDVAARTEMHRLVGDMASGMQMQQVEDVRLPASGSVELKPGSLHIMLFDLERELEAGDAFSLTLQFEKAPESEVQVQVRTEN